MSKAEFQMWHDGLATSIQELRGALAADPLDMDHVTEKFMEMEVDLTNLQKLKPGNKKVEYDFDTALPTIRAAMKLQPKVTRHMNSISTATAPDSTAATPPVQFSHRKAPELQIQPFSGDITLFNSFIAAFHLKFDPLNLQPEEKLQHLKSYLRDEPLLLIGSLELTATNYDIALQLLQEKYDNRQRVIAELYHRIQALRYAENNPASMKKIYYELEGLLTALKAHGQEVDALPPLRDTVFTKYPLAVVNQVCSQADTVPTITEFQKKMATYIQIRTGVQAAADAAGIRFKTRFEKPQYPEKQRATTAALVNTSVQPGNSNATDDRRIPNCAFCNQKHYSNECPTVLTLSARRKAVVDRCYHCLGKNHTSRDCVKNVNCSVCGKRNAHHVSLCPQRFEDDVLKPKTHQSQSSVSWTPSTTFPSTQATSTKTVTYANSHRSSHITLLITLMNPDTDRKFNARALFDTGSNDTYITEKAARQIGLALSKFRTVPVHVFANQQPVMIKTASTFAYIILPSGEKVPLNMDTTPALPQTIQSFDIAKFKSAYPAYANYDFAAQAENEPLDLIIGNDYFWSFIKPESLIRITNELTLLNTKFGWTLVGRSPSAPDAQKSIFFAAKPETAINHLCALDVIGIHNPEMSELQNEENALREFYENLTFVDGRYQIRWPWREFPPPIKTNFGLALGRLRSLQKKLTDTIFTEYNAIIQKQLDTGIIEEVPVKNRLTEVGHYIPHHAVLSPGKSTSVRIVYDGSARPTKNALSINDCIYKGRNLLTNLGGLLLRFRFHKIVLLADIEKAFHQLLIEPQDREYMRFLWIYDYTKPPVNDNLRILRFIRVAFGIVASPFLLNAVVQYHLSQYSNPYISQLKRDIYVDNVCTGTSSVENARELVQLATRIFLDCNMNLRQWSSNDEILRASFEESKTEKSEKISVLGITWNQYSDELNIRPLDKFQLTNPTLREVLSLTSQFYDPCGFFAPLTIRSKLLLQSLHANHDWDTPIAAIFTETWSDLHSDLQRASEYKINRFIADSSDNHNKYALHIFTDASKHAYACAFYLQIGNTNTTRLSSVLIFAKTRIVKPDMYSIPKMELFAVVLATRTLTFIKESLTLPLEQMVLWCDSKCVLQWINSSRILPTFVQKRISEIHRTKNLAFRYVKSEDNPADIPTRGMRYDELRDSNLWWTGPSWLNSSQNWPAEDSESFMEKAAEEKSPPEIKTTFITIKRDSVQPFGIDPCKYSSYKRFLHTLGYIICFCWRRIPSFKNRLPTADSPFACAEKFWIRLEQKQHYSDVIESVKNRKKVTKHPLIRKFRIFLDSDSILRCEHRLQHAPLTFEERCPILLPSAKQSPIVRLMIQHMHESLFHAGTAHTLHMIRRNYWLPRGRQVVSSIVLHCRKCQRYTTRPFKQPRDSVLPQFRLQRNATPFLAVGLDTFGPLYVERNEKRYVLIITDLVIRALDLELLEDMTAEQILQAYRRIAARRSFPRLHVSDNAQQFRLLHETLLTHTNREIQWKFITEYSPWEGGVYERLIALVKGALNRTFHGKALVDLVYFRFIS